MRLAGEPADHASESLQHAQSILLRADTRRAYAEGWFYSPPAGIFDGFLEEPNLLLEQARALPATPEGRADGANYHLLLATHASSANETEAFTLTYLDCLEETRSDGRLSGHAVEAFRSAIRRWISSHDLSILEAFVRAVQSWGVNESEIRRMIEPEVSQASRLVKEALGDVSNYSRRSDDLLALVRVTEPFRDLIDVAGDYAGFEDRELVDQVCAFIRSVAIAQHNESNDTTGAIKTLTMALDLARGDARSGLTDDLGQLAEQQRQRHLITALQAAVEAIKAKDWATAEHELAVAQSRAHSLEERAVLASLRGRLHQERQKRPLRTALTWIGVAVAVVIGLVVWAGAENDSISTSGSSPSKSDLERQIDNNQLRLASLESQINGLNASLGTLDREVDAIVAQMDSLLRTYGRNNTLSEPYYSQYTALRRTYEAKASQYETLRIQQNAAVNEFNMLLSSTNQLIDRFNSR